MARIYSRRGCVNCKRRRKKCDEQRPNCIACTRNQLLCQYEQTQATAAAVAPTTALPSQPIPSEPGDSQDDAAQAPQELVRLLPVAQFRPLEAPLVAVIPALLAGFFVKTSAATTRDTGVLMQLVMTDSVIRDAVISCFSMVVPSSIQEPSSLHRPAFGSALQKIRSQLSDSKASFEKLSLLQIAVQHLGLMETAGHHQIADPAMHWIALALLVERVARKGRGQQPILPRNLQMLTLESVVYHFAVFAPFTKDIEPMKAAWRKSRVWPLLLELNPAGPERIPASPLIAGHYDLWGLAWEVISLHRSPIPCRIKPLAIARRKAKIKRMKSGMGEFFVANQEASSAAKAFITDLCRLHCDALLIAYTALEQTSAAQIRDINQLVKSGLQSFLAWQMPSPELYPATTWALHIFACAISEQNDWDAFNTKVLTLRRGIDPGHWRRLQQVIARVRTARSNPSHETGCQLPGSLFLLQQREGILQNG